MDETGQKGQISRKSSFSSYVQHKNRKINNYFNLSCVTWMWEADRRKGPFPLHVLSCFGRLKSVLFIFCVFWIFEMAGFFSSVIIILLCVCQVLSGVNASKVKSFLLQTALSQKLKEVRRWGLCFSSDDLNVVGRFYNAIHHGSDINRRDQRVCHLYFSFHFVLS